MGMDSGTVRDVSVYRQDTSPNDTRNGVLWIDTDDPERPMYRYDDGTGAWERVIRQFAQGTDPVNDSTINVRDGDIWVDTSASPPVHYVRDEGSNSWVDVSDVALSADVPSDVSGSRALGTWYQNTSGDPITVYAGAYSGDYGTTIDADVSSDQTANRVARAQLQTDGSGGQTTEISVTFTVPDQAYYRVSASSQAGASVNLRFWREQSLVVA